MAKQAPKKEEAKKAPTPKKSKKILRRRLAIPGFNSYPAGTEITAAIEKEYKDYYQKVAGKVLRPIDWYC